MTQPYDRNPMSVPDYNQWLRDQFSPKGVTPEDLGYRQCEFCGRLYRPKRNYQFCDKSCGEQSRRLPKQPPPPPEPKPIVDVTDDWGVWDEW